MIEKFLDAALIVYLVTFIILFTLPLIIGILDNGIKGLKEMLNMLKEKYYYSDVVMPVFILVTYASIIAFLITLLIKLI